MTVAVLDQQSGCDCCWLGEKQEVFSYYHAEVIFHLLTLSDMDWKSPQWQLHRVHKNCGVFSTYQKWSKNQQQGHGWSRLIDAHGEQSLAHVIRSNRKTAEAQTAEEVNAGCVDAECPCWPLFTAITTGTVPCRSHGALFSWKTLGHAIHVDVTLTCTTCLSIVAHPFMETIYIPWWQWPLSAG